MAFVFSGQGPRWWPLTAELLDQEPAFREALERCDASLRQHVEWSLIDQARHGAGALPARGPRRGAAAPPVRCRSPLPPCGGPVGRRAGRGGGAKCGEEIAAARSSGALDLDDALRVAPRRGAG
ncbi:acyltransferase domain-containing protein [Streptomyces sp. L7]